MVTWLTIFLYSITTDFKDNLPADSSIKIIMLMLVIETAIELPFLYRKLVVED